jgi:hypothetical protein
MVEPWRVRERERCAVIADKAAADSAVIYPQGEARGIARATADHIAAVVRSVFTFGRR